MAYEGSRMKGWVDKIVPWAIMAVISGGITIWMDRADFKSQLHLAQTQIIELKQDIKEMKKDMPNSGQILTALENIENKLDRVETRFNTFIDDRARRGGP